jgi:hypothetical protein
LFPEEYAGHCSQGKDGDGGNVSDRACKAKKTAANGLIGGSYMRRIRVAQIGTSKYGHGNSIFQAMTEQPDVFEIVGYVMPEHEREKFPGHLACLKGIPR